MVATASFAKSLSVKPHTQKIGSMNLANFSVNDFISKYCTASKSHEGSEFAEGRGWKKLWYELKYVGTRREKIENGLSYQHFFLIFENLKSSRVVFCYFISRDPWLDNSITHRLLVKGDSNYIKVIRSWARFYDAFSGSFQSTTGIKGGFEKDHPIGVATTKRQYIRHPRHRRVHHNLKRVFKLTRACKQLRLITKQQPDPRPQGNSELRSLFSLF